MHTSRTIALSLASLTLAAGTAIAVPAVASAETRTTAATQSTDSWTITVKRPTHQTIQSERDRVMHEAARAGFATSLACVDSADESTCDIDSFVVTGVSYRTVVATFRYDSAILSIEATQR